MILLHNAIVKDPKGERRGFGMLRRICTWTGWAFLTLVSLGVGFLASWFDPNWRPFWLLSFVFVVAAALVLSKL